MSKSFTKVILIIAILFCPFAFYGQENSDVAEEKQASFNDYVYLSGDFGLGIFKGDNAKSEIGLNGHLGIGYQFDHILGLKANLGYGSLNGSIGDITIDKLNYFEANINLTISALDIIFGYNPDRRFNIAPHIGFGQIQYRVHNVDNEGNTVYKAGFNNSEDGNIIDDGIGGRRIAATIPMGVEVNYAISQNWKLFFDFTSSYADSDIVDGFVSGKHNDWFNTFNIGANYRLGSNANFLRSKEAYCNYWFVMMDGGASFIFGDNKHVFRDIYGNFNAGVGYNFHNYYRAYAKLGYGMYKSERDNFFTLNYADYLSADINISADLVGIIFGYNEGRRIGFYPHIGIGQMQYRARTTYADGTNSQVGYNNNDETNRKGSGLSGRRVAMTVPMGAELTYVMNERIDIYADATFIFADSDLLDCVVSGVNNDWRTTFNVGLRYKFANSCDKAAAKAAAEEAANRECITPEELKQAVEEALDKQAANQPDSVIVEKEVVYRTNYANIVFPANKSEKLDSQTNIDAINRTANELNDGYKVEEIIIEGYASPEGDTETNNRLAMERAEAAAELIQNQLDNVDSANIKIEQKGADWDGLISAIEGSNIDNKDVIAKQIKESDNREQTLRELLGKYPQIRELLPQLRRAGITITTVK